MLDLDKNNVVSGNYILTGENYKKERVRVIFYNGEYFVFFRDNKIQSLESLPDDCIFRSDNLLSRLF